jgi:hypothetical protein
LPRRTDPPTPAPPGGPRSLGYAARAAALSSPR